MRILGTIAALAVTGCVTAEDNARPTTTASAAGTPIANSTDGEVATLKILTTLPSSSALMESFNSIFVGGVNRQCADLVQVKVVADRNTVHPRKALSRVQDGEFDIVHAPAAYFVGSIPESIAMQGANRAVSQIHANGGFALLQRAFHAKAKTRLIAWGEASAGYNLFLTRVPKFDRFGVPDLTGMRIRGTSTYRLFLRAMKASTVNVRSSGIGAMLSEGRIQGVALPNADANVGRLSSTLKFVISPAFYRINTVVVANIRRFEKLNARQKACISSAARTYEKESGKFIAGRIAANMQRFTGGGGRVIQLSPVAANRYLTIAYRTKWSDFLRRVPDGANLQRLLYIPLPDEQSALAGNN